MWSRDILHYMAALIDGEGSILIEVQSPRENRKYYYYGLRLIIINTNKDLMDWLVKHFGGKILARKKIIGRKLCYRWSKCSRQAAEIIEACQPYLIVKKNHAQVFIEFMNTMGITGWNVSQETREYRQFLYEKMRKLTKTGD